VPGRTRLWGPLRGLALASAGALVLTARGGGLGDAGDGGDGGGFRSVVPRCYPIPDDGPVGQLLAATGRHPNRPAHLHCIVAA